MKCPPKRVKSSLPNMPFFPHKETLIDFYGMRLRELAPKESAFHINEGKPINDFMRSVASRFPSTKVFDPTPVLCSSKVCEYRENWGVLYKDDDHLSVFGEKRLRPLFEECSAVQRNDVVP